MSLGKKDIAKNISSKTLISSSDSNSFLNTFIKLVVENSFKSKVKISNIGTFYYHLSPKRIGRNPLTKVEYMINERKKLTLRPSHNIKNSLN